jgi:hypothetical protein
MLLKDGHFVGSKFRDGGSHARRQTGGQTSEFHDRQGKLLKTAAIAGNRGAAVQRPRIVSQATTV